MSNKSVTQDGVVVGMNGNKVLVKIISKSACASCHAKGACSAADMADKIIETDTADTMIVGEQVTVAMDEQLGWLAVFFAFFIPFLLVISTLFSVASITESETHGALASLLILPVYYFFLHYFRDKLANVFTFKSFNRKK
ncbi:SoxR reducing system RseC family protein [bacterium]|nr:SoxR reducing system RseC family protein [bacterium]